MELTCIELTSEKHLSLLGAMLNERHSLIKDAGFNLNCLRNENASWWAEEGLKSHQINHADISITGCLLLWNPRIWKTLLKAHFHQFMTVF